MIPEPEEYRYERKYHADGISVPEIESLVRRNPGMFWEEYPLRAVNNIYLDVHNLAYYFQNVNGDTDRTKARIRWYGGLFGAVERPVLEFKIKHGLLGKKASYRLPPFTLDGQFRGEHLAELVRQAELPEPVHALVQTLEPMLVNHYQRKYFRSADGHFRVTIDFDLGFHALHRQGNTFLSRSNGHPFTIVELKYDRTHPDIVDCIAGALPFRVSKMSKYVFGLNAVDGR